MAAGSRGGALLALTLLRAGLASSILRVVAHLIALVDDLMFLSRVREAARGRALEVRVARKTADVLEAAREGASLLVVDLDSRRLPWAEALASLRSDAGLAALPVVGFLSHVNAEGAQAARTAGCSRVLARSAFVQELPAILAAAARPPTSAEAK